MKRNYESRFYANFLVFEVELSIINYIYKKCRHINTNLTTKKNLQHLRFLKTGFVVLFLCLDSRAHFILNK